MYDASLLPSRSNTDQQKKVLILVDAGLRQPSALAKDVQPLLNQLGYESEIAVVSPGNSLNRDLVASTGIDTVIVICATGQCVIDIRELNVDIIWDVKFVDLKQCDIDPADQEKFGTERSVFHTALARADTVVGCYQELCDKLEQNFSIGVKLVNYVEAFRYLSTRIAVVLGSGLGNMMYATPMIRWLSEKVNAPIDIIIHRQHGGAVELFNEAYYVHRVFPTPAFCGERNYKVLVITTSAAHLELPITADYEIRQNKLFDFNVEGRFVPEPEQYFFGLSQYFDDVPQVAAQMPMPFLRNLDYVPPKNRVVGFANGIKSGTWAKRQWPYVKELVQTLTEQGFEMRCFGLKEEYVEGSVDRTDLSIKDTIKEIAECSYFIGHDCGITHIAEVLGVPTTWIFGPTVATKNGPLMAHSELITSDLGCSPCQFRVDWARCETAACMSELSVDVVASRFQEMVDRVEAHGTCPEWRNVDLALIAKEIRNTYSPCSAPVQDSVLRERISAYPKNTIFACKLLANLWRRHDLMGAVDVMRAFEANHFQGDSAIKALREAMDTLYPFATPCGLPQSEKTLLGHSDTYSQITLHLNEILLEPEDRRTIIQILALAVYTLQGSKGVSEFFEVVSAHRALINGIEDSITNLQYMFLDGSGEIVFNNALRRTFIHKGSQAFLDELDAYAEKEAGLIGITKEEILESGFRFPGDMPAPRNTIEVPLHLGESSVSIPYYANVLLFVPNADPKKRSAGRLGSLVVRHAQQFARMGLCPIIVSLFNDGSKPALEFRDSLFFFYSGLNWKKEDWERALAPFNPRLALCYGDVCAQIELPDALEENRHNISTDGLFDQNGYLELLAPGCPVDLSEDKTPPSTASQISANAVTSALLRSSPTPRGATLESKPERPRFILLVNKLYDLEMARHVIARLPNCLFMVVSSMTERTVMPNMESVDREQIWKAFEDDKPITAVLEFSSAASANLSDLAIHALERDIRVVTPGTTHPGFFPELMHHVETPADSECWRNIILSLLG